MSVPDELLQPIGEDDPGGENLRYEPVYDEIKQARHEDPDVPQGEWKRERKVADWAEVQKLTTDVLANRSKDIQVAAWLTEALLRREGFGGLHRGLELIRRLHEEFWDHLHPRLEEEDDLEFRAAPLEWIGHYLQPAVNQVPLNQEGHGLVLYQEARRVGYEEEAEKDASRKEARAEAVKEGKLTAEDFDEAFEQTPKSWYKELVADLASCRESLEALDGACQDLYGDAAPSFLTLREALAEVERVTDRLLARKLEQDPDPPEEEPVEEKGGETSAAATADEGAEPAGAGGATGGGGVRASGPGGISAEDLDSWEDAARLVAAAARFMRRDRPADPAPYLMVRGLRWGELRGGGDGVDPRLLSAPTTEVRTRLKTLLLDQSWEELLEAGEAVMATPHGRGWLDLQRYILTALSELGGEYDVAAAAIRQALAGLLADLPELPELTLMDDSPTANRETVAWLQEEVVPNGGGGAASVGAPGKRKERRDPHDRALAHVRAGQPQKAVELLMREAAQEQSARARFLRRSEATRIMVREGMDTVAMPILREMMEQIEHHKLEEWEAGDTVARPMALLYRCIERSSGDANEKQQLYLRVCRLDPLQGMSLGSAEEDDGGHPAPAGGATEANGGGSADVGEE